MPAPAWQTTKADIAALYPALQLKYDYLDMQTFLTTEALVKRALGTFQGMVTQAGINSEPGLHAFLAAWESHAGFAGGSVVVQQLLKPPQFLAYVARGITIKDVGAAQDHGWHTHRIQWFLFHLHASGGGVGIGPGVAGMYVNMASPNARVTAGALLADDGSDRVLWDDLVDRGGNKDNNQMVRNATCPEYLRLYAEGYPALNACWR